MKFLKTRRKKILHKTFDYNFTKQRKYWVLIIAIIQFITLISILNLNDKNLKCFFILII